MSFRRLLRIVLSIAILILLWTRVSREWHSRSGMWLVGSLTLSLILALVVILEVTGMLRKGRPQRDEVPKKPLGLDS